ncbi:MAG TPA: 1,2-phenylacetyl-CoA epoxidase subunit PaaC [Chitinophagaceae bacterium]|nr:1,2-phenylacetyl-CoA epoxidase subunit PaaC [Chitinophagaceae bacterium]
MNQQLIDYTLHLADSTLILSQRNAEWCGHGPVLEQDIAITNISLDLIGQARNFYQYAAQLINMQNNSEGVVSPSPLERHLSEAKNGSAARGGEVSEDTLAYFRTERQFKNHLLVEQPNGDWAQTILRQFFFSNYQYLLYQQLQHSKDETIAAIAAKALKEVTYHLRWSSEWVVRLGDGTEESNERINKAIGELWMYAGELLLPASYEQALVKDGIIPDITSFNNAWMNTVKEVFAEATLTIPEKSFAQSGGKEGKHSEYLGYILTELQYMQRTYPGANW